MPSERWTCARCGATNVGTAGSCASCGLLRGSVVVSPPQERPAPSGAPPADTPLTGTENRPDWSAVLLYRVTWPFQVFLYTRARLRQRGGRPARRAMLATAIGSLLGVVLLAGASASGLEALVLPILLLGPLFLGIDAGIVLPGVAGWVFAVLGAAVGGLITGVGLWLGVASGAVDVGPNGPTGVLDTAGYVVLMGLLVPILTGAQLGVGVVVGSGLAALAARRRNG